MKIVFATNNEHKLSEIRSILKDKMEVLSLNDIDCHVDIPETGETLEENALQKAQYIYDHYHMDVFADDTGLEVEALGGAPGVHTARYADEVDHDAEANTRKLLREMAPFDNRKARFRTAIALILNQESPILFEGIVNGEITREKRGEKGFGYDPVFIPEGYNETFAELGVDVKNQISHRARAVQKLVKYLSTLLLCLFTLLPLNAQIGTWRNYLAYSEVQDICSTGEELFVQASNSLYSYNTEDQSITTYDKVNGLSDTYITHIKWNPTAKRLLIVYQNQNMDLMEQGGGITNLSDLYQKTMTDDKTVNSIYNYKQYAYLACGFGIVKVDMERIEISESYNLNTNITNVAIANDNIYAKQKNGQVLTASLTDNLLDPNNWSTTTNYDASIFSEDRTDYNKHLATVKTLNPGGPKYNAFGFMRFYNNKLYTSNSSVSVKNQIGCIQVYDGNDWINYNTDIEEKVGHKLFQIFSLDIDPMDETHLYASGQTGLYEYHNGDFIKEYNNNNGSPFETASTVGNNNKEYVMVTSIKYNTDGHLWCFNSIAPTKSLLELSDNTTWTSHYKKEFFVYEDRSLEDIRGMMFDSRGLLWMANNMHRMPCIISYNKNTDEVRRYDNIVNQDGVTINNFRPNSLAEDKNGNIWVGSSCGPFVMDVATINNNSDNYYYTQVKVPRNDGTNYADYLLNGIVIKSIAIDGGNRKWFGTENNGVYLISADNNTQLQHFTMENSPILSNNVYSIAINNETGEVFFGTENGLCSYIGDATAPAKEMTEDNVYAYPNPVTPDYNGLITIVGLSYDADVKILSTNGSLIAEGRSTGGTFTWDGKDKNGDRVASGAYMVATATSNGNKGVVCKIVIIK